MKFNYPVIVANIILTFGVWVLCKYVANQPATAAELAIVYLFLNNCRRKD